MDGRVGITIMLPLHQSVWRQFARGLNPSEDDIRATNGRRAVDNGRLRCLASKLADDEVIKLAAAAGCTVSSILCHTDISCFWGEVVSKEKKLGV
jgi:hypothetical protein